MKKILTFVFMVCLLSTLASCTGCGNKTLIDTKYSYDYAIVKMPDGEIEKILIREWTDYSDGEQIQIVDTNGKIYLFTLNNAILVKE